MEENYRNGSLGLDVDNTWALPLSMLAPLDSSATLEPTVSLLSFIASMKTISAHLTLLKESLQLNGTTCPCSIGSL